MCGTAVCVRYEKGAAQPAYSAGKDRKASLARHIRRNEAACESVPSAQVCSQNQPDLTSGVQASTALFKTGWTLGLTAGRKAVTEPLKDQSESIRDLRNEGKHLVNHQGGPH